MINQSAMSLIRCIAAEQLSCIHLENCQAWIAGGALRELAVDQSLTTDIDIFGPDPDRIVKAIGGEITKTTPTAYHVAKESVSYDVIRIPFQSMEETVNYFDFTVCAAASDGLAVVAHPKFTSDNVRRRLVLKNLPHPMSTLRRITKYISKGYKICPDELVKLGVAIKALEKIETEVMYVD